MRGVEFYYCWNEECIFDFRILCIFKWKFGSMFNYMFIFYESL